MKPSTIGTHALEGPPKKRPLSSFIRKLWFILTDKNYEKHIYWVDNGQVICIPNSISFSQLILPKFFKHNNWQSFVRQLNLYGFRKVYQLNLSYDDSLERRTVWYFKHDNFQQNKPEKLFDIKRRANKADHEPRQEENKDDSASFQYTTTEQKMNIEKELTEVKEKLAQVDKKRKFLLDQVTYLNELQSNQREAIKILSRTIERILNNNPSMTFKERTLSEIVNGLMHTNRQMEKLPEYDEYDELDEEEDVDMMETQYYSTATIDPSTYLLRSSPPYPIKYKPVNSLPSISSLFHNNTSEILPPIKRT